MSIAIVTGGASGIGRAIATSLVARGDTVVVTDIDEGGAKAVADRLNTLGRGKAASARLDVTDADAVSELYAGVKDEHGRLDRVFNNAGIAVGGLAEELSLDHWNRAIDINLKGVIHGVNAAYPIMLKQGNGHIVNTASLAGLVPMPVGIPYTATKHAVVGLSLGLRAEPPGAASRSASSAPASSTPRCSPTSTPASPRPRSAATPPATSRRRRRSSTPPRNSPATSCVASTATRR
ncbi:SDR family oxidoreductase [Actinomadura sp. CNU-125]|uniref:SDR family oxidoreductase n=1 Tax=Actinomadura sp. CNU-125 TaxID=1904961 RepID=UPI000AEF9736|nr:SDR family oxidoreductase [Actinomadura sp. CNU-125]